MKLNLLLFGSILLLSSCLGTRYLNEGESLLNKQSINEVNNLNKESIKSLLEQKPNKRLVGLPISPEIYIYQIGLSTYDSAKAKAKKNAIEAKYQQKLQNTDNKNKTDRLNQKMVKRTEKLDQKINEGNLLMRWGEPPAVFDSTKMITSKEKIRKYLFSIGYFNAEVNTRVTHPSHKLVNVEYTLDKKKAYYVDSVLYSIKDEKIRSIIEQHDKENLIRDKKYDQDLISKEQDRIFELLADRGYFDFKRQYILFTVDSLNLDHNRLIIKESIANPSGQDHHRVFTLDSVIFNTGATQPGIKKKYRNIVYKFTDDRYNVKILDWRLFIYPDSLYSRSVTLQTQRQLSYLDMFKFVNINYDSTGGTFIANIFTSPLDKYQTSTEIGLSITDQAQIPGPFLSFNLKNRNLFKGMEILEFNGNASIQGLRGVSSQESRYSRLQYGGEFTLTFPQFLFPLGKYYKSKIGQYNPKTRLATGINFEDRKDEYNRRIFNTSLSYIWQVKNNSQFTLKPFDVSYINSELTDDFQKTLDTLEMQGNVSYARAFSPAFVGSSNFTMDLNINNYGLDYRDATFLRAFIETGGNLQNIFGEKPFGDQLQYYKFVKSNLDFRQTYRMNSVTSIAYRINVGVAFVYGDNNSLPYEKYYFAGGSNSIRAWQPRRLGPGAYGRSNTPTDGSSNIDINYDREQPGDIIIETSFEYRRKLLKFLDGAIFVDAGNIWLWNSETVSRSDDPQNDDGVFKLRSFVKEMAVGAGVGFRIDFSFLILRLDGAWKLFNPAYPEGDRFVGDNINLKNLFDIKNDIFTINIGIGYPF